jgi:hypothetical protein
MTTIAIGEPGKRTTKPFKLNHAAIVASPTATA